MACDVETRIAMGLRTQYGLTVDSLARVPAGLGTRNWLATTPEGRFFVKEYAGGADLEAERRALELTEYALRSGIPTPRIVPACSTALLGLAEGLALAVFEYVPGSTSGGVLSLEQMAEAGRVLGLIHRHFAHLRPSLPAVTARWLDLDEHAKRQEIESYLEIIEHKDKPDAFDRATYPLLRQRLAMLPEVPGLLASLTGLTTQVIHNDYSSPNLLFAGSCLVAVVDFRPPNPFLISYELGRIALAPENLAAPGWLQKAAALVEAYCRAHDVAREDVSLAPRVWLAQLIRSTYGLRQHYTQPVEFQPGLDAHWFHRAKAAAQLLAGLEEVEACFEAAWKRVRVLL